MDEKFDYTVPVDFPHIKKSASGLGGAHEKYSMTQFEGRYYQPGNSPPEIFERWQFCEKLIEDLSISCSDGKNADLANLTEQRILKLHFEKLLSTEWVTKEQAVWIFDRVAQNLGWARDGNVCA